MKVGDKVKYLNETGGGTIRAIRRDGKVVVADEDGLEYTVSSEELILAHSFDFEVPLEFESKCDQTAREFTGKKSTKRKRTSSVVPCEIDLHIHEITDFSIETSGVKLLEVQMNYLRNKLAEERGKGVKNFIIIHGVGAGKLRAEIHKFLDVNEGCNYADANPLKYGRGATEVIFWKA